MMEETSGNPKGWYERIKEGIVRECPVEGCKGSFVHAEFFSMYECDRCGWSTEIQELVDIGSVRPEHGWPRTTRTCEVCGRGNDGTVLPTIELTYCPAHARGHYVCRWIENDQQRMVECACSADKVRTGTFLNCPLQGK